MENNLEFKLINNFKCKRCGCTNYDKNIYTGLKTLNDEDSIVEERYICRNCDFPFDINKYIKNDDFIENITMTSKDLLNQSKFIDNGTEIKINDKIIKENTNE